MQRNSLPFVHIYPGIFFTTIPAWKCSGRSSLSENALDPSYVQGTRGKKKGRKEKGAKEREREGETEGSVEDDVALNVKFSKLTCHPTWWSSMQKSISIRGRWLIPMVTFPCWHSCKSIYFPCKICTTREHV